MKPFLNLIFLFLSLFFTSIFAQKPEFNADSAYAYNAHLAVTIGPRKMGSLNERAALRWAAEKFRSFGADSAYVMPFLKAPNGVNTTSGVAIGIFRGQSDSMIVVGGHIDSAPAESPGASDNASGTACTIELARMWSNTPRRYTMLFAAFGGEESGLVGSKYFVDHYQDIKNVALMLNIDMAGSEGWLIPFIDVENHQSPRWLVEDSYAIDRSLGYNDLEYPTHFFSINGVLAGGGAGSDHIPFMDKEIAAISFTSGINIDPIHTPLDRMQFLSKPMLARSGRLVDKLIEKYQNQGIPPENKGHYMMWQTFLGRFFIPDWLLIAINALAVILGMLAFLQTRKLRLEIPKSQRGRVTGLKLILLLLIIALVMQLGEWAMQAIQGVRYPWLTHFDKYMWFAAAWALVGGWMALQFTKKWRFHPDPYVYIKRAIFLLVMYIILLSLVKVRLAFYPALTLLMAALSVNISISPLQILFTLLAPLPMLRLMFMETLPLIGRSIVQSGGFRTTFMGELIFTAIIAVLVTIWFLPIIFLFAYTIRSAPLALNLAKLYRKPATGLAILLIVAAYGGYLYSLPAYSEKWKPEVRLEAEYDQNSGESKVIVKGNDYLRNVTVAADTLKRHYDARILSDELPLAFQADWAALAGGDSLVPAENDSAANMQVNWQMITRRPWHATTLTVGLDTLQIDTVITNLNYQRQGGSVIFQWSADPPDTIEIAAQIVFPANARIIRKMKAVYPEIPLPIEAAAENAVMRFRTTVSYQDTIPK